MMLADVIAATKESRSIDFKSAFDPTHKGHWCELLKDVFAFANSGGGIIVVGVDGKGVPVKAPVEPLLALDPAVFADKIRSYTGTDFDAFDIIAHSKNEILIAIIQIGSAETPIVPIKPGTYEKDPPKQHNAFSVGVVYVRHGAKSEPATSADLARVIDKRVRELRNTWMSGIKKVTTAPARSVIEITKPKPTGDSQDKEAVQYRLVIDEKASAVSAPDFDKTHPYRTNECMKRINVGLAEANLKVTVPDMRAVIAVHTKSDNVSFTWKSVHGPRQYSQAFIDWIVEKMKTDKYFARKAKLKLRRAQN